MPEPTRMTSEEISAQESRLLIPVSYSGATVVAAVYLIRASTAHELVDCPKLHPLILPGNRSVSVITMFDFKASSIGPYKELSIGILASTTSISLRTVLSALSGPAPIGAWVLELPVSSPAACRGGIELFGYPKSLACIDVHDVHNKYSYSVRDEGREVVSCELTLGRGVRLPIRQLVTYSKLGGDLLETKIPVSWHPTLSSGRGVRMRLGTPGHRVRDTIARLLLPAEPIFILHGAGFEAILNAVRLSPGASPPSSQSLR
jgi:hypothetical protein